jgi:hypothetical protein
VSRSRTLALAALVLLIAGCGGSDHAQSTGGAGKGAPVQPLQQATVRTANCILWNALSGPERQRLVVGLRSFFGGHVDRAGTYGQVLPDPAAHRVLNAYCHQPFARAFLLYRIYGDAAAFTPPRRPSSSKSSK